MRGLKYTFKILSLYLIIILFFPLRAAFSAQGSELNLMQKQARLYRDQGWDMQRQGDIDTAFAFYQKAIILDPSYVIAYNDIGVIEESRGNHNEAKKMYQKAVDVSPDYPNTYSNLALLYEEEGDYAQAISCWVKRATMGGASDPWAEVARRRLEEIAHLYPQAYKEVGTKHEGNQKQR